YIPYSLISNLLFVYLQVYDLIQDLYYFPTRRSSNLKLICEDNTCMDDIIIDHWLGFTRSKNDLSPAYIDLLHNQKPQIKENKIIITARNSAEAAALFKRIEQPFKDHFETIGLGNMKLEVIVSTEIEEIENFKKKTIEEDRKIA